MSKNRKEQVQQVVIDAIAQNTSAKKQEIKVDGEIGQYISDSIEFVKVLIAIEDHLEFEFIPEELRIDNIYTVSELIGLVVHKLDA